jgi:hypothetical protein
VSDRASIKSMVVSIKHTPLLSCPHGAGVWFCYCGVHTFGRQLSEHQMSRIGFAGACLAAGVLALSSQAAMAQGELQIEPHPYDSILSPYPLGPLQKFGDPLSGSAPRFSSVRQAPAPRPRQAHVVHADQSQAARRPSVISEPRQLAARSFARQPGGQRGLEGTVLSLAPRYGERVPSRQFCFPSSTIHIQQSEGNGCYAAAPARSRFEELLGE